MTQTVKAEHTAGPWEILNYGSRLTIISRLGHMKGETTVASIKIGDTPFPIWNANARLIAAAPTMYEALRALIGADVTPPTPADYATRGYRSFEPWQGRLIDAQNDARAAIKLAEGEK